MSESTDSHGEVDIMFNAVKQRYGDRLSPEELEEVRKGVEGVVKAAGALRSVTLDNGAEPFSVFTPYRREG